MLTIFIAIGCICVLCWYVVREQKCERLRKFPVLRGIPVIGNVDLVVGGAFDVRVRKFIEKLSTVKDTSIFWILAKPVVLLMTPEDIKTVLTSTKCLSRGTPYEWIVGDCPGFIIIKPDKWKPHRRLINTAFNMQTLQSFVPELNRVAKNLVDKLISDGDTHPNLVHVIGHSITDIQTSTLFGYQFTAEENIKIFNHVESIMQLWDERMLHMFDTLVLKIFGSWFGIPSKDQKLYGELANLLRPAFDSCMEKYRYEKPIDSKKQTEYEIRNSSDYFLKRLSRLLDHGYINEKDFVGHSLNALLAGTDTSTIATCNILLCLAMNPNVQNDLFDEINDVVDSDSGEISYEDLMKLSLLERVFKESLRILPVVSMIGRNIADDIQLENGLLHSGTDIIIPIVSIHRSRFIWGDHANKFNPDNFLPENLEKRHSCSYIPFGYGPRNCLGYKFALIFIRIQIAYLVRNFKFNTTLTLDELKFNFRVTSTLSNGYKIDVEKRK